MVASFSVLTRARNVKGICPGRKRKKIDKKKDEARYDNVTLRISRYALEQEP